MTVLIYSLENGAIKQSLWSQHTIIPEKTLWLDLFAPTREEEEAVEAHLAMDIPTREEMREIEVSNRLYSENGLLFMTATLLTNFDAKKPENHATTFILSSDRLITVRYIDPLPFRIFPARLLKDGHVTTGHGVFLGLLEAIINRAADILETITVKGDEIAKEVFVMPESEEKAPTVNYEKALIRIGQSGDTASKVRESLTTLWRVVAYAQQNIPNCTTELQSTLAAHAKDISALSDHAAFISNKLSFLLDATLGMINISQNNIIKIFSIAAVIFLPPTLVASVYGMNFRHMPELNWHYGYPIALLIMVAAAVLPILYFRQRKWL